MTAFPRSTRPWRTCIMLLSASWRNGNRKQPKIIWHACSGQQKANCSRLCKTHGLNIQTKTQMVLLLGKSAFWLVQDSKLRTCQSWLGTWFGRFEHKDLKLTCDFQSNNLVHFLLKGDNYHCCLRFVYTAPQVVTKIINYCRLNGV